MHTIAYLRDGLDAIALTRAAARRGVTVAPISRFSLDPVQRDGLVLGFSGFTPAEIRAGALDLRRSIDDLVNLPDWTGDSAGMALSGEPNPA